jgi:subtilisin family serine protease
MALINASDAGSYAIATGEGVKVGVLDTGVDFNHADIAPNLDVDLRAIATPILMAPPCRRRMPRG